MRDFEIGILAFALIGAAGLGGPAFAQKARNESPANGTATAWEHVLTGKIVALKASLLQVEARDKRTVEVDAGPAIKSRRTNALVVGAFITAYGAYDSRGVLHAQSIQRAKRGPAAWPADH